MTPEIEKNIDAFIERAMLEMTSSLVIEELVLITSFQNNMRCLVVTCDGLKYCKIYSEDFNSMAVSIRGVIAGYFS